jgi:nicotinamide-nucleotide amidase
MSDHSSHTEQSDLEDLAAAIGELLKQRGETLCTAESCTGGWVSMTLTAIAGSSAWFERGFVTYSNQAKQELLGVPADVLASHGAVSTATASAMTSGAQQAAGTDWAIAITGIAGPDGGSTDKPVGTVCFGWAGPDGLLHTATQHFHGDRRAVRQQAVRHCLRRLRELLNGSSRSA